VEKIFADALAWSASIAVHRAAVPCETPGAWQLPLLFGALPSWERALEKEWSNPSFDHLQLRKKQKKKKRSPSLACHGSTQNYPLTVFDLSHIISGLTVTSLVLSFLSFFLKICPPPPPSPRDTLPPLLPYLWAGSV
jgi:hypothetical protein